METLDRCFENVCELDLIFHVDRVHNVLQEICTGGMVLETNMSEILTHVEAQNRLEKSEATAVTTLKVGSSQSHVLHNSSLIRTGAVLTMLTLYIPHFPAIPLSSCVCWVSLSLPLSHSLTHTEHSVFSS